jgi:hypothetical protein
MGVFSRDKNNSRDAAIESALSRVDAVLAERQRIEALIAQTASAVTATNTDLEAALERLAVEEAVIALTENGGPEQPEAPSLRDQANLRLRLEALRARQRGLEAKLTESEDAVRGANDNLTVARDGWMRERIAEFRTEYLRAAEKFAAVLRKGAAIGDTIGADELSAACRMARIYDPSNLQQPVVDMEPTRSNAVTGMMERYPVWQDDPSAKAVHDSLAHVRLKADAIQRVDDAIRKRREEAAQEALRVNSEKGRPRTRAYELGYSPTDGYSPIATVEFKRAGNQ